jgi:hypothetical protein
VRQLLASKDVNMEPTALKTIARWQLVKMQQTEKT